MAQPYVVGGVRDSGGGLQFETLPRYSSVRSVVATFHACTKLVLATFLKSSTASPKILVGPRARVCVCVCVLRR